MAKKHRGAETPKAEKLRLNVGIDADLRGRLGAFASHHHLSIARVVEDAIAVKLRGFHCVQRENAFSHHQPSDPADVLPIRDAG